MRYILQGLAMLSDILIIFMCALFLVSAELDPLACILVYLIFRQWKKSGGFEAWEPKTIKQFFANAKKYGL